MMRMLTCSSCQSTGPLRHLPVTVQFSVSLEYASLQGHASKSRFTDACRCLGSQCLVAGGGRCKETAAAVAGCRKQQPGIRQSGGRGSRSGRRGRQRGGWQARRRQRRGRRSSNGGDRRRQRRYPAGGDQRVAEAAHLARGLCCAHQVRRKTKASENNNIYWFPAMACCNFLSFPSLQPVVTNAFPEADHLAG